MKNIGGKWSITAVDKYEIHFAPEGKQWKMRVKNRKNPGRYPDQNIMCQSTSPTIFASKFVKSESVFNAWLLLVDNKILQKINECTETEARHVLKTDSWTVTFDKLHSFIIILYALCVFRANKADIHSLGSN